MDNTSPQAGGGLFNNGTATLTDDTIANNFGKNANGAGLNISGTATLIACTISGNTTTQYGGGIYDGGLGTNKMTLDDTIVAGNISTKTGSPVASDIAVNNAVSVYGSYNFIGPGGSGGLVNGDERQHCSLSASPAWPGPAGGQRRADRDHGPLSAASPAIAAGSSSIAGVTVPTTDQRGLPAR